MTNVLKAPFPWFGGKSRVAHEVWQRFGDVPNYVEPFAGSLAVLLARPTAPRVETVNDINCFIANFWRAVTADPEGVATAADWPINEADLHARHLWLVNQIGFREKVKTDPDYFDVKIAGWWVWGICQWIGSGWCAEPQWRGRSNAGRVARGVNAVPRDAKRHPAKTNNGENAVWAVRPFLGSDGKGQGVLRTHRRGSQNPALNEDGTAKTWQKRRLSGHGETGVHRKMISAGRDERGLLSRTAAKRPRLARGHGRGVLRTTRQIPDLGGNSGAVGRGIHASANVAAGNEEGLYNWMLDLADRLRRVRVCCGDWKRVTGPAVTHKIGLTGVFLDPPYDTRVIGAGLGREGFAPSGKLYEEHDNETSLLVRSWAIENGDNPLLRIAVCGYEGEHEFPETWEKIAWKANGGFSNQGSNGAVNATRERIWFSPHCRRPNERLFTL